jgi:selenium metabolism protein YedF
MNKVVDARGLSCPQPVILTRKAMADSPELVALVDSETSRDNVRRMAEKAGRQVTVEDHGGEFHLHISSTQGPVMEEGASQEEKPAPAPAGSLVLVVPDSKMGRGDKELGEILVRGFFHTLGELESRPDTILFFNAGVWLTGDDSPVLEDLRALEAEGVSMLVCGTCLNHFDIKDRLAVGLVSNMYDIAEAMLGAGKVLRL